jgi:cobalamin synthase
MSAVATTEAVPVGDALPVQLAPVHGHSVQQMHGAEQKRWMLWFGIPALVASVFVGLTFSLNQAWIMGLAITAIVVDIFVLVWLAMTSDTNGATGDFSGGSSH